MLVSDCPGRAVMCKVTGVMLSLWHNLRDWHCTEWLPTYDSRACEYVCKCWGWRCVKTEGGFVCGYALTIIVCMGILYVILTHNQYALTHINKHKRTLITSHIKHTPLSPLPLLLLAQPEHNDTPRPHHEPPRKVPAKKEFPAILKLPHKSLIKYQRRKWVPARCYSEGERMENWHGEIWHGSLKEEVLEAIVGEGRRQDII